MRRLNLGVLAVATIALWTATGAAGPLDGQEKESEADRAQRGCGPPNVKHRVQTSAVGRFEQPTPDKAVLHVVRPESFGAAIQTKLGVDGKWVGVNVGGTYFTVSLDPGAHLLCSALI